MKSQVREISTYKETFIDVVSSSNGLHVPNIVFPPPTSGEIEIINGTLSVSQRVAKRIFDLLVAAVALLIFAVPMCVIAILIRLTSKGPIFYGQERITINGRHFIMLKFRSMKEGSEANGAVWAIKDDPRRTRLGSFLRASSLDELPQLWNVLRGEMSIVGPRPERPYFVEIFRAEIPNYDARHQMKSGITGWAQICGWRGNTSIEKRVQYDLLYIKRWSIWFDFKILCLTLIRGFINKNAY